MRVMRHWNSLSREVVDAPSLEGVQDYVGQNFEQLDLVKDVPAHGKWVALDDVQRSFPTQIILWFFEVKNTRYTSTYYSQAVKKELKNQNARNN